MKVKGTLARHWNEQTADENYQNSQRRLGGPGSGHINVALKHLNCPAVTPSAVETVSASPVPLFFQRS